MYIKRNSVYFNSPRHKFFISYYSYTNSTFLKEQIIEHQRSEVCIYNWCKISSMRYITVTKDHSLWLMADLLMVVFGLTFQWFQWKHFFFHFKSISRCQGGPPGQLRHMALIPQKHLCKQLKWALQEWHMGSASVIQL